MNQKDEFEEFFREGNWAEVVFDRWVAFFTSLKEDPPEAKRQCCLGMKVVRNEVILSPTADSNAWTEFFQMLIGRPNEAEALCCLGMRVIKESGAHADYRSRVEAILLE